MSKKTSSKTEKETWIEEAIFGLGSHHKTTISDGDKKVEGRGSTSEKSQKVASDKWDKAKDSGSDSSSGSCFLTTACTESKGLPDDCHELSTLRYFRDSYIAELPDGQQLISEYYNIAPAIVGAINRLSDPRNIYNQIYDQLVLRSVQLIDSGKLAEALSNYRYEVIELKQKFLQEKWCLTFKD